MNSGPGQMFPFVAGKEAVEPVTKGMPTSGLDARGRFGSQSTLTGSAPTEARRAFLGLWFAQIAIAAAAIALTDPPFAVMAPVWGIGIITWWASAHATFPPRQAGEGH